MIYILILWSLIGLFDLYRTVREFKVLTLGGLLILIPIIFFGAPFELICKGIARILNIVVWRKKK